MCHRADQRLVVQKALRPDAVEHDAEEVVGPFGVGDDEEHEAADELNQVGGGDVGAHGSGGMGRE